MKTINISEELHTRLKNAAEFSGASIQDLVSAMIERDFKNAITVKEFTIDDIKDIELYRELVESYIRINKLNEDDYKATIIQEIFKKPIIRVIHK